MRGSGRRAQKFTLTQIRFILPTTKKIRGIIYQHRYLYTNAIYYTQTRYKNSYSGGCMQSGGTRGGVRKSWDGRRNPFALLFSTPPFQPNFTPPRLNLSHQKAPPYTLLRMIRPYLPRTSMALIHIPPYIVFHTFPHMALIRISHTRPP